MIFAAVPDWVDWATLALVAALVLLWLVRGWPR